MNWYKAKTILIVFLVIVNAALLTYICIDSFNSRKIENKVVDTVISLLNNNNIDVDKTTVAAAEKYTKIKKAFAVNTISDYTSFSKLILGENTTATEQNKFTSPNGTIVFTGDYFDANASDGKILKEFIVNTQNIKAVAKEYLTAIGINADIEESTVSEENGKFIVNTQEYINGYPVFGAYITLILNNKGILSVQGTWYDFREKSTSDSELKDVTGVLIDYKNQRSDASPCKITKIELGYSTLESDVFHESIVLTPVWKITNDSNQIIYIDARENI